MTLPNEELMALKRTKEFLRDLLDRSKTKGVPKQIRGQAYSCLRHYPWDHTIEELWEERINKMNESMKG